MAEEPETVDAENALEEGRKRPGLLVWAVLGVVSAVMGFALPFVLPMATGAATSESASEVDAPQESAAENQAIVPFGEVTVNLDEGRLNRYLRVSISLQIDKADEESITKRIEIRGAVLRNWLLSHLSDKGMDDIRGAAGQNRLRREIRDHFNTSLFDDGYDRIYDVLFEEFNIQ